MNEIDNTPSAETARALLVEKLQEARATTTYAATIFTFYLGINAVLFKVGFNDDASFDPAFAIRAIAVGTGVIYFVVCICYWLARRLMLGDVNHLNVLLNEPLKNQQLQPLKYTAITAGLFTVFCTVAWIVA